jgi:hypothetical protein
MDCTPRIQTITIFELIFKHLLIHRSINVKVNTSEALYRSLYLSILYQKDLK